MEMKETVRQHYLPKLILRQHNTPIRFENAWSVWLYDKQTCSDSICKINDCSFVDYLYELHDENGNILKHTINLIEHVLGRLETQWGEVLKKVRSFQYLNDKDLALLYALVAIQILRTPDMIDYAVKLFKNRNHHFSDRQLENFVKVKSFLSGLFPEEETSILYQLLELLVPYTLTIYSSLVPLVVSADVPVCMFVFNDSGKRIWTLPVSRSQCIVLSDDSNDKQYKWMTDIEAQHFNENILLGRGNFIISCVPPSRFIPKHDLIPNLININRKLLNGLRNLIVKSFRNPVTNIIKVTVIGWYPNSITL